MALGKPLISHLLDRLSKSKLLDRIIVATSTDPSDDPIANWAYQNNWQCYRGPLENVAARFLEAVSAYKIECMVRISGDSPLIDWRIVDRAIEIFERGEFEIVTNCLNRTFPRGQSVELLLASTYRTGYERMKSPEDFEHVTRHFYQNAELYRIHNFETDGRNYSNVNLCVDTLLDFENFVRILKQMDGLFTDYTWQQIVEIYERVASRPVHSIRPQHRN